MGAHSEQYNQEFDWAISGVSHVVLSIVSKQGTGVKADLYARELRRL